MSYINAVGQNVWVAAVLTSLALLGGCDRTETVQRGFRGSGMVQMYNSASLAAVADTHKIPTPEDPADLESPRVDEVFVNVKVLNDLSATEFSRLMQALSTWVAPVEGCHYCDNPDQLESDEKYPKIVARRMLQMTRDINTK